MCKMSLKVLIADDSALLRERLTRLLSAIEGVEVAGEAPDGATALQLAQVIKPDALILDLRMPGGSGIEVLQQIRQDGGKLKVIILTSFPYPQYRERCLAAGADYFFDKSEELELVSETLRQLSRCKQPEQDGAPAFSAAG
ncbi:MAG: response regulator transcription factor [Acidobacteria bacterium]|nr:response regulator transcription factor [Acidobacteriota bacterium]